MICSNCVTPAPLKRFIEDQQTQGSCKYCGLVGAVVDPGPLYTYILSLVDKNTAGADDLSQFELGWIYHARADDISVETIDVVLSEWFDLGHEPYFDELMNSVPPSYLKDEDGTDRHFYFDDGQLEQNSYEAKWDQFIQGIKHSHRFFNSKAKGFLDSVFGLLTTVDGTLKPEVVRVISKGDELYRARTVADHEAALKIRENPHEELGAPPSVRATNQRMTPNGISALYCALDRNTCLSEIRSITGDLVVSGALTPLVQLRLLDLTKLELVEPPRLTVFDDGYRDSVHLKTFIKSLVKKMSRPKARSDELSYLSTQVVFEYLRLQFGTEVEGLAFPSVQTGEAGTNVVLFPEACVIRRQKYQALDGIELALGPEPMEEEENPFDKEPKLAVVDGSLRYHHVKAIETKAEEYEGISELFMSDLVRKRLGLTRR